MKIEAPGGETADLHRRVWVGVGGTSEPSYLRTSLKSLGVESDLDLATPWTFACFKSKGGARAYFHGGLSPQELIIPVVVMTPTAQALVGTTDRHPVDADARVQEALDPLLLGPDQRVRAAGCSGWSRPRCGSRSGRRGSASPSPVSASYGFEEATGDVQLRSLVRTDAKQIEPNTVTLMVDVEEIGQKTVSVSLLDATSGAELASIDKIEVAIII